jgi:hypothetical protein
MNAVDPREKRLAEAVAILVEAIHHDVPTASTRPLAPYDDEDFTLEVRIPAGMDRNVVMDTCIRYALAIEDRFGFLILTRVKVAEAAPRPTRGACLCRHGARPGGHLRPDSGGDNLMELHPITTEQDYDAALRAIKALWTAPAGSPERA